METVIMYTNILFLMSVSHKSEEHVHESNGHKITSSVPSEDEHRERKADRKGIYVMYYVVVSFIVVFTTNSTCCT